MSNVKTDRENEFLNMANEMSEELKKEITPTLDGMAVWILNRLCRAYHDGLADAIEDCITRAQEVRDLLITMGPAEAGGAVTGANDVIDLLEALRKYHHEPPIH